MRHINITKLNYPGSKNKNSMNDTWHQSRLNLKQMYWTKIWKMFWYAVKYVSNWWITMISMVIITAKIRFNEDYST